MTGGGKVDEAHMPATLESPPVLSYRRPQRDRPDRAIHLVTPGSMALHYAKGSAFACVFPLLAFSCMSVLQHPAWGLIFTAVGLIAMAALALCGGITFYGVARLRLAATRDRVRLLFAPRGVITWTGAASPLVVIAILAFCARLLDREPDWRIILPAMCAPAAVIAALVPRPLRRR